MPAALSSIELTDGTTTATLSDTDNYGLLSGGWSPQIATRRTSVLGGRPYTQVVEEMRFDVYGDTMADCIAHLAVILRLIDQAYRWSQGESFDPVRIEYQPQGSTMVNPLSALVYGFADNAPPATLPATYNDLLMCFVIENVTLRFVRDGAWLGDEEDITVAAALHPSVVSGTFTGFASHLSPVKVELGQLPNQTDLPIYDTGYVLIADRAARIQLIEAEGMGPINDFTVDADATRKPSGTGVLVYTPTTTDEDNTALENITLDEGRRVGIVAAVRNSHASTSFAVRVEIAGPAGRSLTSSRPYIIDPGSTDPRIVLLGVVLCEEAYASMRLYVQADAVAGTLSIDYLALINLDNPTSRIVSIGRIDVASSIPGTEESYLTIDPRALEDVTPRIRLIGQDFPTLNYAVPQFWRGDPYLLSLGTTIAAMFCLRNSVGGYWIAWDTAAAASIDADVIFTRRISYLAPE